jgi:hypothetical protein
MSDSLAILSNDRAAGRSLPGTQATAPARPLSAGPVRSIRRSGAPAASPPRSPAPPRDQVAASPLPPAGPPIAPDPPGWRSAVPGSTTPLRAAPRPAGRPAAGAASILAVPETSTVRSRSSQAARGAWRAPCSRPDTPVPQAHQTPDPWPAAPHAASCPTPRRPAGDRGWPTLPSAPGRGGRTPCDSRAHIETGLPAESPRGPRPSRVPRTAPRRAVAGSGVVHGGFVSASLPSNAVRERYSARRQVVGTGKEPFASCVGRYEHRSADQRTVSAIGGTSSCRLSDRVGGQRAWTSFR